MYVIHFLNHSFALGLPREASRGRCCRTGKTKQAKALSVLYLLSWVLLEKKRRPEEKFSPLPLVFVGGKRQWIPPPFFEVCFQLFGLFEIYYTSLFSLCNEQHWILNVSGCKWEGPQPPLLWSRYKEGERKRESDADWRQLHNHSILLMLESRRIFSFNSLKWRAPLLTLKCKQEAFEVRFSQKWNAGCSYWSKTLLLVFVLLGIHTFCDGSNTGLLRGQLEDCGQVALLF